MAKKELRLSEESAKAQLELFLDWYGMDYEEMFGSDSTAPEAAKEAVSKRIFKRLRQGYFEVKEEESKGEMTLVVVQHLDKPVHGKKELKYKEIKGSHRSSVKVSQGENETAQMYHFLGAVTGEGKSFFDSLRGVDIGVADMIGYLFLLV